MIGVDKSCHNNYSGYALASRNVDYFISSSRVLEKIIKKNAMRLLVQKRKPPKISFSTEWDIRLCLQARLNKEKNAN